MVGDRNWPGEIQGDHACVGRQVGLLTRITETSGALPTRAGRVPIRARTRTPPGF